MDIKKHVLLLVLVFSISSAFAQLIVNDDLTPKGVEGGLNFEEGSTIPNLRFKNLKAVTFNLHEKIDKLTIIEFWYIGCKQCVANKKYLEKFSGQYKINLLSISIDEKPSSVRRYLADNNIHWENINDNSAFTGFYQKTKGVGTPTYLVVNADKEIIKVFDQGGSDIGKMGVFIQNYFK